MKVLLINPSRFYSGSWSSGELGQLFNLYSYIREHCPDVEVDVLDLERELPVPQHQAEVHEFCRLARHALASMSFDVVGISCWTSLNYLSSIAVAKLCKELNPACVVVVGGYHPSCMPTDFTHSGAPVDYVVVGEGEETLRQIVEREVPLDTRPKVVRGIQTDPSKYNLLWDEYKYYRNAEHVQMWLTRGCPFSCAFCLDRMTKLRGYDPARAVAELVAVTRTLPRLRSVSFMDPIFGFSKQWRQQFFRELANAKLDLRYWAETRADILFEDDIKSLGELRFHVDLGLDAVSPRMISIMMKAKDPVKYLEGFVRTHALMNKHAVPHHMYTLLNYPGETRADLDETLRFWEATYDEHGGGFGTVSWQGFKFFPGCEVFSNIASYTARFGTQVLHPSWWKMPRPTHYDLSGQVIPSRDIASSGAFDYHTMVGAQLDDLVRRHTCDPMKAHLATRLAQARSATRADGRGLLIADDVFFASKRFVIGEEIYRHAYSSTRSAFYNFRTRRARVLTADETALLDQVLTNGAVAVLEGVKAEERLSITSFLDQMLESGILSVDIPVESAGDVGHDVAPTYTAGVIRTSLGDMQFRLFPLEAPRTVQSFSALARGGYFDGVLPESCYPGTAVVFGEHEHRVNGSLISPLEGERTPRRHTRGSLSMSPSVRGWRLVACRRDRVEMDGSATVFGEITEGLDLLDKLLCCDIFHSVSVR